MVTSTQESAAGVADVIRIAGSAGGPARLLFDVPHGATDRADLDALTVAMQSPLPPDLVDFFHVNTDVGAPELAVAVASLCAAPAADAPLAALADKLGHAPFRQGVTSVVLRSRIPRTLVDCNRLPGEGAAGLTGMLPDYIVAAADIKRLHALHAAWLKLCASRWQDVCGAGGVAVALHSYAPRSVAIDHIGADIVRQLHAAWAADQVERWPLRPPVDLIHRDVEGVSKIDPGLLADLRAALGAISIEAGDSATYPLHPATTAARHAARWPGQAVCIEVRRDLLVEAWRPFEAMRVDSERVRRIARPLAVALLAKLRVRS